jgi:hypothetical protein
MDAFRKACCGYARNGNFHGGVLGKSRYLRGAAHAGVVVDEILKALYLRGEGKGEEEEKEDSKNFDADRSGDADRSVQSTCQTAKLLTGSKK